MFWVNGRGRICDDSRIGEAGTADFTDATDRYRSVTIRRIRLNLWFLPLLLKRDEAFIVLMLAFPSQEVVITTSFFFRESAADFGTMFVNGAVSPGRVKEPASAFENVIFTVSQHATATRAVILDEHSEFALGLFITHLETLRQSRYVTFRDFYPVICATVSRTL
jgi:hypothetical protein